MAVDSSSEPESGGEVRERLARVETKQDHLIDKLDDLAGTIEGDLGDLKEEHEELDDRTRKLTYGYKLIKWGIGSGGLLAMGMMLL